MFFTPTPLNFSAVHFQFTTARKIGPDVINVEHRSNIHDTFENL